MANDHEEAFIQKNLADDMMLEKILSKFRPLGPFYLKFMPFLVFSAMTNAFYCTNYVFAAANVEYRCKYECEETHEITEKFLNVTHNLDRCHKYQLIDTNGDCSVENINTSHDGSCTEWMYEDPHSLVADFNLGCQDWKRTLIGTVHVLGYMMGLLLLGPVSDKLGRKKLVVFTGLTGAVMGLARSITTSYWVYIALEWIESLLGDSYSSNYMLGVEMVTKENRVLFASIIVGSSSVAGGMMALAAWLIPYWRYFLIVIYGPGLLFILHAFFLPESARWLLIKGRKEEAKDILRKAAKTSNIDIDEAKLDSINCERSVETTNLVSLMRITFSSRKLLLRFLACSCMWITSSFNKYALLINSVSLEGSKHLNYALTALADLPACVLLVFILTRFKRKNPLIGSFLLTGFFCVAQSFIPKGYPQISIPLFLIGKFTNAISYATVYLYTSELFPTYTRNTMHALCSSIGRIGTMIAPQTPLLIHIWSGLPSLIIGSLSLTTGAVIMMMPDTSDVVLPDTVREAEALGPKKQKWNLRQPELLKV